MLIVMISFRPQRASSSFKRQSEKKKAQAHWYQLINRSRRILLLEPLTYDPVFYIWCDHVQYRS